MIDPSRDNFVGGFCEHFAKHFQFANDFSIQFRNIEDHRFFARITNDEKIQGITQFLIGFCEKFLTDEFIDSIVVFGFNGGFRDGHHAFLGECQRLLITESQHQ